MLIGCLSNSTLAERKEEKASDVKKKGGKKFKIKNLIRNLWLNFLIIESEANLHSGIFAYFLSRDLMVEVCRVSFLLYEKKRM